jgi:hypothetical protein
MLPEEAQRLIGEIGTLRAECEELRVRNEMLQYHLERERRWVRELERQVQELQAMDMALTHPCQTPPRDPPLGWGKGADE